jgi:hypothetical protein
VRPEPICTRPPIIVSIRHLAAESAASAALALVESPAFWEALTLLSILLHPEEQKRCETLPLNTVEADEAIRLLEATDHAARSWATIAFPNAGLTVLPHLGKVT